MDKDIEICFDTRVAKMWHDGRTIYVMNKATGEVKMFTPRTESQGAAARVYACGIYETYLWKSITDWLEDHGFDTDIKRLV